MEVRHILGSCLILVLFDLTLSADDENLFRSHCLTRSKSIFSEASEQQKTEPSINATAPKEKLKTFRISLPTDFKKNLDKYQCNCHKKGTSNPLKFRRVVNTCPSVTRSVTIGWAAWGCWIHKDFVNHECPYTTCDHFNRCTGVTTNHGIARCVQDQFKEVIFYVWCWRQGRWRLQEKRLFLPTCCSCRWFCK